MWISDSWQDFEVLDCSRGEKLERWGKYTLVRPDPQAIWDTPRTDPRWRTADGRYSRSHTGGGSWDKRTLPPSYGRGPGGEVWKLETNLWPFVELVSGVLSDDPLFVIINSYTTGLSPSVLTYLSESIFTRRFGGHSASQELGLPVTASGLVLPCGATCRWER